MCVCEKHRSAPPSADVQKEEPLAEIAKAAQQDREDGDRRVKLRQALSGQVGYIPDGEDLRHGTKYIRPVYLNKATIDALVAVLVP